MDVLNDWFAFDWPWIFPATLLILILIYRFIPSPLAVDAHACGFVITFFLPIALPLTAALGTDFWFPLVLFVVLYLQSMGMSLKAAGEVSIVYRWHPYSLVTMTVAAVVIRFFRYLLF